MQSQQSNQSDGIGQSDQSEEIQCSQVSSIVSQFTIARSSTQGSRRRQGIYWILTIPEDKWDGKTLPECAIYAKGQLESGGTTDYRHWQFVVGFKTKKTLAQVRELFGPYHSELTRSVAAEDYVWKDATYVEGTRFEYGRKPINRKNKTDWDFVWKCAIKGNYEDIPADIRIRSYFSLRRIYEDFMVPVGTERTTIVYWGGTGVGKSRRAWEEAGADAYSKNPNSKFWSGYKGERNVVIDEFRGKIDVSYLLTWLDRYPLHIETKGSGRPAMFENIWICSNLPPKDWYPGLDEPTLKALLRRLRVVHMLGTPAQALMEQ